MEHQFVDLLGQLLGAQAAPGFTNITHMLPFQRHLICAIRPTG